MVRVAALVFCLLCLAACVWGQSQGSPAEQRDHFDVILLKNGAVIKGHIVDRREGKKLTVRLLDGKTMDVPFKKIQAITSSDEDWQLRQKHIQDSLNLSAPSFMPTTRIWQIRAGGQLTESKGGGCISAAAGILSPRSTAIWMSMGFERNSDSKYVPFMCELEHYVMGKRLAPFVSFGVGYSIGWLDAYQSADYGGLRIQIGVGFRLRAWDHEALQFRLTAGSQQVAKTNVVTESHVELVHATVGLMLF